MSPARHSTPIRRVDIANHARQNSELTGATWSEAEAPVRIGLIDKFTEHDVNMPSTDAPPHLSLVLLLEGQGYFLMGKSGAPCEFHGGHAYLSCSWEPFDCLDFIPAQTRFRAVTLRFPLAWRHAAGRDIPGSRPGCDVHAHARANAWLARIALTPPMTAYAQSLFEHGLPRDPLPMLEAQAGALRVLHETIVHLLAAPSAGLSPALQATASRANADISGRDRRRLLAVQRHIDTHAAERLSIADVAALAGMSETALKQGFSALFGVGVHNYVIHSRCRQAAELLRNSALPVSEVALRCGFSGPSHLARHFRPLFGTTPLQYRHAAH